MQNESKVDLTQTFQIPQTDVSPDSSRPVPVSERPEPPRDSLLPKSVLAGVGRRQSTDIGWSSSSGGLSSETPGAVSGLREQLEGPDARILPAPRSESRRLPTTQTEDAYIMACVEHSRQYHSIICAASASVGLVSQREVGGGYLSSIH